MKRFPTYAALAALVLAVLVLSACSTFGSAEEGSGTGDIWGYVASADAAQLEVAGDQRGTDTLVVDRVLAPEPSWIVVHLDEGGTPGMRVGLMHVDEGENTDVEVPLAGVKTPDVIVAVHADRDVEGTFDFDMMNKEGSPDRPFFVDGKELATVVAVREFGVPAAAGEAAIETADQPGASEALLVDSVSAPTGAWIVVHLDNNGIPGDRVGLAQIPAGESTDVKVELDPYIPLTETLLVAVHADRGEGGAFEFDMMNKVGSPDQPFSVDGEEVAIPVRVK